MDRDLKILTLFSFLGCYAETVVESKEADKTKRHYRNAVMILKECSKIKPKLVNNSNMINVVCARHKAKHIQDLEDVHFKDGYWNSYALCVMCLEYLVEVLEFTELKEVYIKIDRDKIMAKLEKDENYKELQKISNRYFADILEIIGE